MSKRCSVAPARAKWRAISRPRPRPAPVTRTVLPAKVGGKEGVAVVFIARAGGVV